ncbi:type II toxin-antitoxin system Phd/YefM family antitoxin [Sphaerimonospora cavernae]|uniref:Antitoxin n=1 Tax=Sphaerimonospora cavernae TaxID=1740611 RepID=A0ABV6U104_9ACTN
MSVWSVQQAERRFSALLERARAEGPQIITQRDREVAVVVDIAEYRRLKPGHLDFKEFLCSGPDLNELDIRRSRERARLVEPDAEAGMDEKAIDVS